MIRVFFGTKQELIIPPLRMNVITFLMLLQILSLNIFGENL
jgi:hypothetical protein